MVGNKTDLESRRQITFEEGQEMANHYGVRFLETSAKECKNVETAFTTMTREIKNNVAQTTPARKAADPHKNAQSLSKGKQVAAPKKSGCC